MSFPPQVASQQGEVVLRVTRGTPAYRRICFALFFAGFATFSLLYCVQPLLPLFAHEFGVTPAESSLALSLTTGLLSIAILCASALSERCGRRGLMFASMALAAVCNLTVAGMHSWHGVLVVRAIEGFVLGGVPAIAMAYLAEEMDPAGLGLSMGLYVGGSAFGGMVGRLGISIMSDYVSWRAAMGIIGVIDFLAAASFIALLPASRHFIPRPELRLIDHARQWRRQLNHAALPAVFLIGCLAMGVFVTVYNYADFRLSAAPFNLSSTETGLIFSAYVFGIVASSVAGALADRFGRGAVVLSGICVAAIGILLTLDAKLALVVAGIAVLTIGFFITHSAASSWVGMMAQGAKSYASSLYLLSYYLGSSFLGSVGGWFWQKGGWPSVSGYAFALLAGCLGLVVYLIRNQRRSQSLHRAAAQ